jgi:hypothetical protein
MVRRALLVVVALAALLAPATASATLCGAKDPKTGETAIGRLTLDESSRTDLAYRRSEEPRALLLVFDVEGCSLDRHRTIPSPQVSVTASNGPNQDLPREAVGEPQATFIDPHQLEYRFDVDTDALPPGSYNGAIEIRAEYLQTSRTPVSASRSEPNWRIPAKYGMFGGAAGIIWYMLVTLASSAVPTGTTKARTFGHLALVFVVGVIFGGVAGYGFWHNQDVWTTDDNAWPTIVAGFTGATTSAVAALATQLIKHHSDDAKAKTAAAGTEPEAAS